MIIYKTTNLVNGKIYIGQDSHNNPNYLGSGLSIRRAILKYGKENFIKEVLEENIESKEKIDEREIYWIDKLQSMKNGYNLTKGGGGILGKIFTEEERKHMSDAGIKRAKEKPLSVETRAKLGHYRGKKRPQKDCVAISKGRTGIKLSYETKIKISISRKSLKLTWSNTHRENFLRTVIGKPRPASFKQKMSEKLKDPNHPLRSKETRQKIGDSNRGKKRSPEVLAKIRATRKPKTEEQRKKISEGRKKYLQEKRNNISEDTETYRKLEEKLIQNFD